MALYDDAKIMFLASGAAGQERKDSSKLYSVKPAPVVSSTTAQDLSAYSINNVSDAANSISVSGGVATFAGDGTEFTNLSKASVFEASKKYKVVATVEITSGAVKFQDGITNAKIGVATVSGKYAFYFTSDSSGAFSTLRIARKDASQAFNFTVSDVSVSEVNALPIDFDISRDANLDATRVGPTGLIEKGRENLVHYSNSFINWDTRIQDGVANGLNGYTLTSGQAGYDGSNNATLVEKTNSNNNYLYRDINTITHNGVYTYSIYARDGGDGNSCIHLYVGDSSIKGNLRVNLNTGAVLNSNSILNTVEAVSGKDGDTDRWYRVSFTNDANVNDRPRIQVRDNTGAQNSNAKAFVQDAQFELGLVATDVITTTGAATATAGIKEDEPRFDYPLAGGAPSLLIEPQRQNKFAHSEYMAGTFNTIRSTFSANAGTSPEGVQNATAVFETTVNDTHGFQKLDIDIDDGTFYSYSFFVKANGRSKFFVTHPTSTTLNTSVLVDLSGTPSVTETRDSTTGSQSIIDYGDGWYRVEISGKEGLANDADGNLNFFFDNGSGVTYTGDVTKGLLFYGFQLEEGKFCSSYIPCHGAAATRSADTLPEVTHGITMGTSITLFLEAIVFGVGHQISLAQLRLNDANRLLIFVNQNNATATTHDINAQAKNSDANYVGNVDTTSQTKQKTGLTTGATFKCIARIDGSSNSNNFDLFVNGSKHGTAKDVDAKDIFQKISLIRNGTATDQTGQKTKSVIVWASALTDQQCEDLTAL